MLVKSQTHVHVILTYMHTCMYMYCVIIVPCSCVIAASGTNALSGASTQQMKEAAFLHEVREALTEERANQLRW